MRLERVSVGLVLFVLFASGALAQDQPARATATAVPPAAPRAADAAMKADGDVLVELRDAMRAYNPGLEGHAYFLTTDTKLDPNWLKQTPNVWGKLAKDVPDGAGAFMANDVEALISSATKFVDVTSLQPFPTGRFQTALTNGLTSLAKSKRNVTVRVLVGWYPGATGDLQNEYLKKLIAPLQSISGSNLTIYVAIQRINPFSFNHSKMVAVDGQRVILGGENLWDEDYLQTAPVHDINLGLTGSFVHSMHKFADQIWMNVCGYKDSGWKSVYWKSGMPEIAIGCLSNSNVPKIVHTDNIRTLGAGRLSGLFTNGSPADVAIATGLGKTAKTLRIAQQDLGSQAGTFWAPGMNAIAGALVRRANVYIVLSNYQALAGPNKASYSNGVTLQATADAIKLAVTRQAGAPTGKELIDLLCSNLNLTNLRFNDQDDTWPNQFPFALHAKFFMVDDSFFYVGSENLYPSDLIEFGVFHSDPGMVKSVQEQWWNKLWQYSKRAAISGSGVSNCYFRPPA
jgi:phosphatidylserine/phosphatidylglycerophosphate/cardiolipin synthase-like enzyme